MINHEHRFSDGDVSPSRQNSLNEGYVGSRRDVDLFQNLMSMKRMDFLQLRLRG